MLRAAPPEPPPARVESWDRATTSGIHAGFAVLQTRPGSPMPGGKTCVMVIDSNSSRGMEGECQVPTHRRTPPTGSIRHKAPNSHPSLSQMALSIRGVASASVADSARAQAVSATRAHCCAGIRMPVGGSSDGFTPAPPRCGCPV